MGAPLTQAPAVANWIGEIYSVSNRYALAASSDLTLTIGFANGRGSISGTSTLASINNNFSKDSVLTYALTGGSFDTRGVMTGSIKLTLDPKTTVGIPMNWLLKLSMAIFLGLLGRGAQSGYLSPMVLLAGFLPCLSHLRRIQM